MGQYWIPANLDKKEFIDPHKLATGLKLWEQLANHPGTGAALIILCAAMPEPRGGGDLGTDIPNVVGRWAGDRIALVGDYAERGDLADEHRAETIYGRCRRGDYTDISAIVCEVIEKELDGHYEGDGWRDFKHDEEIQVS